VVDLRYSRNHQGYYTSLSRGMSAGGTLILGGFHPSKVCGGASGALRQEFRELELLDEITTLHYDDKLSKKIAMADRRNSLIALFREKKGLQYMPSKMHKAIRWNKHDPYLESDKSTGEEIQWRFVELVSAKKTQFASGSSVNTTKDRLTTEDPAPNGKDGDPRYLKRDSPNDANLPNTCAKRLKTSHNAGSDANTHLSPHVLVPIRTQWQNNSCAYDAICTVLFNVWREEPVERTLSWNELDNDLLNNLTAGFNSHVDLCIRSTSYTLEQIRDHLRHRLASLDDEFAFSRYASVHVIMNRLLMSQEPIMKSSRRCHDGHTVDIDEQVSSSCEIVTVATGVSTLVGYSIQEYMDDFSMPLSATCPECRNQLVHSFSFASHPPLLCIELWQRLRLLDSVLHISVGDLHREYNLRGIIYFSGEHFTSRVITRNGMVWFHDGIFTGRSLIYESPDPSSVPIEGSILAVYIRDVEVE